ncbi:cytochrome P450 [Imleria badia]|nr:cytochrome P450 [Imleria badia]
MEWSPSATQLAVLVTLTVVTVDIIRRLVRNRIERKGYPLPPGPSQLATLRTMISAKSLPNLLMCAELRAKHSGDLIYFDAVGTDIILLNSTSLARELLDKRSQIYSDRPAVMAVVAPFYDFNLAFLRYGDYWRTSRRIWHQSFRAETALRFRPMQLRRARELLVNIIDNPAKYQAHFSTFSVSVTLSAGYDYEPIPRNDPMVSIVENFVRFSGPGLAPGKVIFTMVFPFLRHISNWLPGPWFQRQTKVANVWKNEMLEKTHQYIQERMESKEHTNDSMVWDHINETEKPAGSYRSESGAPLKGASASALTASLNTTAPTLMVFILAMVENPRVWKRAQAEIDAVVGTERLPEFDDRASLPYVDAILREVFRWGPVLPLGGLHATTQSDIYEGYYIPKGTVLATNVWAISREEARYPDGDNFIPERFLDAEGTLTDDNPSDYIFGFGRRVCPGRHVADGSLWASMATMLATLEFNLAKDADGNDIAFEATFSWGLPRQPNPFPCRLTPRPHISKDMIDRVLSK